MDSGKLSSILFSKMDIIASEISVNEANVILADLKISEMIPKIRQIRAIYEFEIEKKEALRVLLSPDSKSSVNRIIDEYAGSSILDKSLQMLIRARHKKKNSRLRCLIVGSGSLPITAIMLYVYHNLEISCLDISEDSCIMSSKIFSAIGIADSIKHITADIFVWKEFSKYDIVFINGMVCSADQFHDKREKFKIVEHLKCHINSECLLILRSGYALSQLFYPQINPSDIERMTAEEILPSKLGRTSLLLLNIQGNIGCK